jgi:cytosine deaminase
VLQVSQPADLCDCFDMISSRSARILNATDYGVAVGNPADLVVIDTASREAAIAEIRRPLAVFKRGRKTMVCEPAQLLA